MIVTFMKTAFEKLKPKTIHCRDCKNCSINHFRNDAINELSMETIKTDSKGLKKFLQICLYALN